MGPRKNQLSLADIKLTLSNIILRSKNSYSYDIQICNIMIYTKAKNKQRCKMPSKYRCGNCDCYRAHFVTYFWRTALVEKEKGVIYEGIVLIVKSLRFAEDIEIITI